MHLDVGVGIAQRPAIMRHRIRDALGPSRDPLHPAELVASLSLTLQIPLDLRFNLSKPLLLGHKIM